MASPTFYVASPLGERTAGPELLTQLVDALRRRHLEAYLIPMWTYRGRRNHPEYDRYDFEVADRIADPDNAVLVVPEVSPIESWRELAKVPRERTWMGWFSVNNSADPRARYYKPSEATGSMYPPGFSPSTPPQPPTGGQQPLGSTLPDLWREARRRTGEFGGGLRAAAVQTVSMRYARTVIESPIRFIAQSFYAQGFCREVLGRDALVMTDPMRVVDIGPVRKERNVVLFNQVKASSHAEALAQRLPDVEFRPLGGKPYDDAMRDLASATLYIELGHLPGRDRLPREAAFYGTPVVTLCRGAGYLWADVPLPVEDRIPYLDNWETPMVEAIQRVIADPHAALERQASYREWVVHEPERYERAVDEWVALAVT
jgi:hypothetical protein